MNEAGMETIKQAVSDQLQASEHRSHLKWRRLMLWIGAGMGSGMARGISGSGSELPDSDSIRSADRDRRWW